MQYYNHYNLRAIAEENYEPWVDEDYTPVHPCEVMLVTKTWYVLQSSLPVFRHPSLTIHFKELGYVASLKVRSAFEVSITLRDDFQYPAVVIQELQMSFDAFIDFIYTSKTIYTMTNLKSLLPSMQTNFLDKETGELKIKYRPGYPRNYRFNASRGVFSLNPETDITSKGEALVFVPVSYRLFRDDILGFGLKKWVEFFFVNKAGHLCSLLFHGFSVDNLERCTNDLFYDGVNLSQVVLTAKPVEKVKAEGEGKGSKYFVAEFSYKVLDTERQIEVNLLSEGVNIWRADTLTGDATVELSVNYKAPIQALNESDVLEDQIVGNAVPVREIAKAS